MKNGEQKRKITKTERESADDRCSKGEPKGWDSVVKKLVQRFELVMGSLSIGCIEAVNKITQHIFRKGIDTRRRGPPAAARK